MLPQLDRWERKMKGKVGWTLPGAKRSAYIESLKPERLRAKPKEPAVVGFCDPGTGGMPYLRSITHHIDPRGGITVQGQIQQPTGGFTTGYYHPTTISNECWPYTNTTTNITFSTAGNTYPYGITIPAGTGDQWYVDNNWVVRQQPWIEGTANAGLTVNGGLWIDGNGRVPLANVGGFERYRLSPQEAAKQKWREQLIVVRPGRGDYPAQFGDITKAEGTALVLLRRMLSDQQWRRYLKYGFIMVQGQTGLRYQIVRGQSHLKVYRRGDKIAELCLAVDGNCPPTDHVITKKIMVECDEMGVWTRANIHGNAKWGYGLPRPTEKDLVQLAAS